MLVVSDTTDRVNWGARGASLALRDLLGEACGELTALPTRYVDESPRALNTFLPKAVAAPLIRRRGHNRLCSLYSAIERSLGMLPDYVDRDPEKTADNILRFRDEEGVRPVFRAVADADVVVVDGDGDLIFKADPGRINYFNLGIVELARSLGKPVHWVNSIFADCPRTGRNAEFFEAAVATLAGCSTVALRDPHSVRLAESDAPRLDVEFVPDSQFHWLDELENAESNLPDDGDFLIPFGREHPSLFGSLRFDEPYVCLAGGSRVRWERERAVESYSGLVDGLREQDVRVYLTPTCSGDEFMFDVAEETGAPIIPPEVPLKMGGAVLAGAEVFVTGRYHPGILAALSGTPCVFLEADSHKTLSLQELLDYEDPRVFSAWPSGEEVADICRRVERYRSADRVGDRIREAAERRCAQCRRLPEVLGGARDAAASRRDPTPAEATR